LLVDMSVPNLCMVVVNLKQLERLESRLMECVAGYLHGKWPAASAEFVEVSTPLSANLVLVVVVNDVPCVVA